MNKNKVYKNVIWNLGLQLITLGIPLLVIPYISRVLGPEGVGVSAFTSSTAQYFVLLANLGISIYGSKEVAMARDNRIHLSVVFWRIMTIKVITSLISLALFSIIVFNSNKYQSYYYIQYLLIMAVMVDVTWFFQGIEQFRKTVLRNIFTRLLIAALTFAFVRTANDTYLYILFAALTNFVANITLWIGIRNYINFDFSGVFNMKELLKNVKGSLGLFIPQIATQIYLPINKNLLGLMIGIQAVGYYDNSDKIVKVVVGLVTSIGTVLLPHVAHFRAKGQKEKVYDSLNNVLYIIVYIGCLLTAMIVTLAPRFCIWFFGNEFKDVGLLMQIEAPVIFLIAISNAIGYQYLIPMDMVRKYSKSVTIGALTNIILDIPLILLWGFNGAMVATVVSEFFVVVIQIKEIRNVVSLYELFKEFCKYLICAIFLYLSVQLCDLLNIQSGFLYLIVSGLIGTVTFFVFTFIVRPKRLYKGIRFFKTL